MFVLDTNTLIHFFKGQGSARKNIERYSPKELFIPSVVLYELEVGSLKSTRSIEKRRELKKFASYCSSLNFGPNEALVAAQIRFDLEKSGKIIGPMDLLIAASALANGFTLITHNVQEFKRVKGLRAEDWY